MKEELESLPSNQEEFQELGLIDLDCGHVSWAKGGKPELMSFIPQDHLILHGALNLSGFPLTHFQVLAPELLSLIRTWQPQTSVTGIRCQLFQA